MNKFIKVSSLLAALLLLAACTNSIRDAAPDITHDGLEKVSFSRVDLAYAKPGVDFSGYSKFMVLPSRVAFKKGWEKDFRDVSRRHLSSDDLEKMKVSIGTLFDETFVEELQDGDGYEVVSEPAEDALLLRPALVDIEVTAPLPNEAIGRTRTYSSSAGDARLYLEVFDSLSGEILARIIDHREVSNPGDFVRWQNGISNQIAARSVTRRWANLLLNRLDEVKQGED